MAITQDTYTGNGVKTNYTFTFPYIEEDDVKVSLDGVDTTAYTFANATTIQFNTAPGDGVAIRIYRNTSDENLSAVFYSGSAIRSQDLNNNFTQALYVAQETKNTTIQASTGNLADGSITSNLIADGAVSNSKLGVNSVTEAKIANGAVTTSKIADSNVTEAKLSFTPLKSTDIGVTVQGYDATTLKSTDIGTTVQAYDADTAKLDVAQTFTADQTFTATQTYPKIPQNAKTAAYTLVAADAGKHISITTGGITVPSGVFAVGDAVSIYNNSASSQTITQGASTTLRLAGSASTGNRTLSQYGLCTILCVASNTFVVSGAIVS